MGMARLEFLRLTGLGTLTAYLFGNGEDATPAAEVEGSGPGFKWQTVGDPSLYRRPEPPVDYYQRIKREQIRAMVAEIRIRGDAEWRRAVKHYG